MSERKRLGGDGAESSRTRKGVSDGAPELLNRLFRVAWLTFLAMGVAAGGLALCSINLLALFQANFSLLLTYGAMAACSRAASTGAHARPLRATVACPSIAPRAAATDCRTNYLRWRSSSREGSLSDRIPSK